MSTIRSRVYLYVSFAILGGAISALLMIRSLSAAAGPPEPVVLCISNAATALAVSFSLRESFRLKAAQLIMENQILHINAAKIANGGLVNGSDSERIDVYISCFGILLNHKIVKFNQERIQLKSVEIDKDYIVLTYGNSKKTRRIQLLHAKLDEEEMMRIVDRFRYETGIIPAVVNKKEEM